MLPVMIALVMLCLLILFGVSLIVICVKRRKKKRRNREFEINSSETPEHTYEEPDTSISHFNQKLSTLKMSDESHKDSIMVEENVAYRSFNSIPAATIKQSTY